MRPRSFYIISYGCQMNRYDSELVESILVDAGWHSASSPDSADVVLVNTCTVRQHAEDRAIGRIRTLIGRGKDVGIMGCAAQRSRASLLTILPGLKWVIGPDQFDRVPEILESAGIFTDISGSTFEGIHPLGGGVSRFVAITRGCDNFCSYCIVPFVRGRLRSRSPDDIILEIRRKVADGALEITLLGQNVNSYRYGDTDFPILLRRVARLDGISRVRFVTNHPRDLSAELVDVMRDESTVMPSLHLPLQSGSDRILKKMNRRYTLGDYLERIEIVRAAVPDTAIATDIIVGFPSESESDFEATLDAIKRIGFSGIFAFHYSERPGTAAARMNDDVPRAVKLRRLREVIKLGQRKAEQFSRSLVGSVQDVLVERLSKKRDGYVMGSAPNGRIVEFLGDSSLIGKIVSVRVEHNTVWTLIGKTEE